MTTVSRLGIPSAIFQLLPWFNSQVNVAAIARNTNEKTLKFTSIKFVRSCRRRFLILTTLFELFALCGPGFIVLAKHEERLKSSGCQEEKIGSKESL